MRDILIDAPLFISINKTCLPRLGLKTPSMTVHEDSLIMMNVCMVF